MCNSAESIVDDLMELAIETPEKKTKDTTSGKSYNCCIYTSRPLHYVYPCNKHVLYMAFY